jgi:uncharacterized protein (TIGR02246 family)
MQIHRVFVFVVVAVLGLLPSSLKAQKPAPTAGASSSEEAADEQAIRKTAADFETAYRAKDADAIARLYTSDGEIVDIDGTIVRGRGAITREFRKIFQMQPQGRMSVVIASIRLVAPGVAVEDGTTRLVSAPNQPPILGRYAVVHVKQEGRWQMASVRDLEPNSRAIPASDRLKPLEFLIGDWVDEGDEALVATSYRWGDDRQCLLQDFAVKRAGRPLLKGTQRIGWDPLAQTIKSWAFDSAGGHSEGIWTWDRDHWVIKLTGVGAMGATSSATVLLTPLGRDAYRRQSTSRIMAGEALPNVTVMIVRRPPEAHPAETGTKSPPKQATRAKEGD